MRSTIYALNRQVKRTQLTNGDRVRLVHLDRCEIQQILTTMFGLFVQLNYIRTQTERAPPLNTNSDE